MIGDVAQVQAVATPIAWIEDFLEVLGRGDAIRLIVRQRAMAQMVDAANLGIGVDDPLRQHGQASL